MFNATTGKVIWLKEAHKKREVASLTKIMTCHIVIMISERLKINLNTLIIRVSEKAENHIGTSAEIKYG